METVRNRKAAKPRNKPQKAAGAVNHIENLIKYGNLERQEGDGQSVCEENTEKLPQKREKGEMERYFTISFQIDLVSIVLLVTGVVTRMYRLREPNNIV